jgi:hypothetical protein
MIRKLLAAVPAEIVRAQDKPDPEAAFKRTIVLGRVQLGQCRGPSWGIRLMGHQGGSIGLATATDRVCVQILSALMAVGKRVAGGILPPISSSCMPR